MAVFAVGVLTLTALFASSLGTGGWSFFDNPRLWTVTRFTILQATLSVLVSVALALPVARALSRRPTLPGRRIIVSMSAVAMIVPTTVAALGLLVVWGRNGWLMPIASVFGVSPRALEIYGLPGILLGHVFFNAPLMMRIFLSALDGIPEQHWRLAAQLGMRSKDVFRLIEWPVLRTVLPGAAALVFLLCFTSFAMVLMLGGGPSANTLEVSIYEAVRFDFDLALAAKLSVWQMMLCALVLIVLSMHKTHWLQGRAHPTPALRLDANTTGARVADTTAITLYLLLVLLPLAAIAYRGFNTSLLTLWYEASFIRALSTSVTIALLSALITVLLAWLVAETRRTLLAPSRLAGARWAVLVVACIDTTTTLYLALPAIVIGTGFFLLLRGVADPFTIAPVLVIGANVLLSLPFALRLLQGRLITLARDHDRLCASLAISGWNRLRVVELPAMRRELSFAAGLTAALSMGDLGVIALFGSNHFQTLPWLLYQTMNRYRADEAGAMALLLLLTSTALFAGFDALGRKRKC